MEQALTFDDVLLLPARSDVLPAIVDTSTNITCDIRLNIPIISAAMDTVTEAPLAIAMAQQGGIGCIHKNFSIEDQVSQVRQVKKFESEIVEDPLTISANAPLADALNIMQTKNISGIPVVNSSGKLVGIITNRDVRFVSDDTKQVRDLMTHENLITVKKDVNRQEARKLLHKYRLERLLVVDDNYRCIGLITVKDIKKKEEFPNATRDKYGHLRVFAAISTGDEAFTRASALVAAGVDALVVDTAHGHSNGVLNTIAKIKKEMNIPIIAGNIATKEGAESLIGSGADAVKVGIGPGSICTTRIIAGVGVPQLSAVMNAVEVCDKHNIPVIADGGIKFSGDLAKAIAGGASCAMIGSLFAGTSESPGEVILYQGRSYKAYRGMGSIGAMERGSADRYFQKEVKDSLKLVPEGIEGRVPFKGSVLDVIHQLVGGLRSSMGYTGNPNITSMRKNCKFVKITNAGLRESHVHDVTITKETPNYRIDE